MAALGFPPRLPPRFGTRWQEARILAVGQVTPRVKEFRVETGWTHPHRAGQHADVRLTAPDGYQAQRSYSIASAPDASGEVTFLVELLEGGEVSGYFHEVAAAGDVFELRGPIGAPFTWDRDDGGPLLLVGGGSGVAPLLSILRRRAEAAPDIAAVLLLSARTEAEAIELDELCRRARDEAGFDLVLALTREPCERVLPPGVLRRLDRAAVEAALLRLGRGSVPRQHCRAYVCGANRFAGPMADLVVDCGVPAASVQVERFGG